MASSIPVVTAHSAGNKSKGKRIGALLDLSRGEPPLNAAKRIPQKEFQKNIASAPQARAQLSRIPQSPSIPKQAIKTEPRASRPPFSHETQASSTGSRSGIPMIKSTTLDENHCEAPKHPRRVLRRKQPTILKQPANLHAQNQYSSDPSRISSSPQKPSHTSRDPANPSSNQHITQTSRDTPSTPRIETLTRSTAQQTRIYPELDRYKDIQIPASRDPLGKDALYRLATEDLPPPTPLFSGASSYSQSSNFSASPSTRFSGSPGTGPYSRDTTPTSMCSQSPGFVAPVRLTVARARQTSPAETRPPITRRRAGSTSNEGGSFSADPQGLAAVREALTSSSSSSTVRTEEKISSKVRRGHPAPHLSPPPRKSSQKFKKVQSTDETQLSFQSRISHHSGIRSPSPGKATEPTNSRTSSVTPSHQRRPTPPSRPSRDGTPDLYSQFGGPIPVIHSNLSSTSLSERRQSGQLQANSLPRPTTQRTSHDHPSSSRPSISQESSSPRTDLLQGLQDGRADTRKTNRIPSPSVPPSRYRFPIFGRRTKASPDVAETERKRAKITRKGPAAGTGHEGYGRVGAVRRRSFLVSTLHTADSGPVASSESLLSTQSADTFLLERMSPVIIAGGEVVKNQNTSFDLTRTESNQSASWHRPSLSPRKLSATSTISREDNRQTLWPSPSLSETTHSHRPPDHNSTEEMRTKLTLLDRRSSREFRPRNGSQPSFPKVSNTRAPSAASMATTIYTDDSFPDIQPLQSHTLPQASSPVKKLTKTAKSPRKWNLFGRNQAGSPPKKKVEVPVVIQASQNQSPVFSTTTGSLEQEYIDEKYNLNAVLHEVEVLPVAEMQLNNNQRPSTGSSASQLIHTESEKDIISVDSKRNDILPQILRLSANQDDRQAEKIAVEPSPNRPSRLPQVGRIPKVMASRPEQTSPKSFSRPFNRVSIQGLPTQLAEPDQDSIAKGPSPRGSVTSNLKDAELPTATQSQVKSDKDEGCYDNKSILEQQEQEFLVFPPYGDSSQAEGSESSGSDTPDHAVPIPHIQHQLPPLGVDEVWDEFNDLLEDSPPSPTSSCGLPFPLETYYSSLVKQSVKPLESPTYVTKPIYDVRSSTATARTTTESSHYSADMTARINAAFRFDSEPPPAPLPKPEPVPGYDSLNHSAAGADQDSNTSPRASSSSNVDEGTKTNSARTSRASERISTSSGLSEETPLSQVNLRVGSMTVSKWLTFGHVLFSPVREDLADNDSSLKRQSLLVIDGLGNDDWSFYAAETYPAANFFNLSPRAPVQQEQTTTKFPLSPPNHHQIQFTSHADKFPFGPDSFTALVFRFPAVAPESHYRNIISEAQRVLKPGGFIEFAILDVDLNNVGNRTRRAVRHLKEQVSNQNPDFYLSSTADLILRLLGKKGFVDIKTCRLGVPVASSITAPKKNGKKDERSLAEMMNDDTEVGDKSITKMVSKVGRWWYNRCYEVPIGMKSSIWHDKALLTECEEWGTSLKLMVCHARVPEARPRNASV
ncbi:hypothetical protein F5B22DRAFT_642591 [Xylaria bambusicola]|uniref:uncharacterized protein n=1 Tax=Xylaria bambusicola TaxID=326684 RepID=UPI00200762C8|nr:uncharacterized protein F5B22DRAFT_642591 [Xylaria bambusicola]KAI0525581.1 hypothetical protein F5B22DRAFT_642591 [Xylaria bambusicola]